MQATVATEVAISDAGAGNELLLRELQEGAIGGIPVSELISLDGGESPA